MALAYATDLATGHSRDFALRSCVLAMRMADAARLDDPMRRAHLSSGAASLHRLQRRHPPAGGGVGRRDRAAPGAAGPGLRRQGGVRRGLRQSHHAPVRGCAAGGAGRGGAAGAGPGCAGERPDPVGALRGRAEDRGAAGSVLPSSARASARSTSAGTDGIARGLAGEAVKFSVRLVTLAQDAIALMEAHGFATMTADDRQARRRRLRTGAGRALPRARGTIHGRTRRARRPRDHPGAGARRRTRCSTRRRARRPIWRSPTSSTCGCRSRSGIRAPWRRWPPRPPSAWAFRRRTSVTSAGRLTPTTSAS